MQNPVPQDTPPRFSYYQDANGKKYPDGEERQEDIFGEVSFPNFPTGYGDSYIKGIFSTVAEKLKDRNLDSGSTLTLGMFDPAFRIMRFANLGDTPGYVLAFDRVAGKLEIEKVTTPHNADNSDEVDAVIARGAQLHTVIGNGMMVNKLVKRPEGAPERVCHYKPSVWLPDSISLTRGFNFNPLLTFMSVEPSLKSIRMKRGLEYYMLFISDGVEASITQLSSLILPCLREGRPGDIPEVLVRNAKVLSKDNLSASISPELSKEENYLLGYAIDGHAGKQLAKELVEYLYSNLSSMRFKPPCNSGFHALS